MTPAPPPPPRTPMTTTEGATRATSAVAAASNSAENRAKGVIAGAAAIGRPGGAGIDSNSASLTDRHLDILRLAAPDDPDRHWPADPIAGQPVLQFFDLGHGLSGERHDDVADQQAALVGRAFRLQRNDQQPLVARQLQ